MTCAVKRYISPAFVDYTVVFFGVRQQAAVADTDFGRLPVACLDVPGAKQHESRRIERACCTPGVIKQSNIIEILESRCLFCNDKYIAQSGAAELFLQKKTPETDCRVGVGTQLCYETNSCLRTFYVGQEPI